MKKQKEVSFIDVVEYLKKAGCGIAAEALVSTGLDIERIYKITKSV